MGIPSLRIDDIKTKLRSPETRAVLRGLGRGTVAASIGLAGFSAAALLYKHSPEFHDTVRFFSDNYPVSSQFASSSLLEGLGPDAAAQRYAGGGIRMKRLAGITLLGGTNGLMIRQLYDLNNMMFPGDGLAPFLMKILMDVGVYTALNLVFLLSAAHLIYGNPLNTLGWDVEKNFKKVLPVNITVWGLFILPIIYSVPKDLMLFTKNIFTFFWRAYVYNVPKEAEQRTY